MIAIPPVRSPRGRSGRESTQVQARRLSPEQIDLITRDGRSLREIAADLGVSHETIRQARKSRDVDNLGRVA